MRLDRRSVVPALAIAVAAAVAYAPALAGGFVFDDHKLVEQSALVHGPLWRIWFSSAAADYWPLTYTSFWLEWRVWGAWPAGYHATNLLLHAGVAILLWRVLAALGVPGAWLAGLLFAVHPVTVESVAWISERKNTLSGVLALGSALAWIQYVERVRRVRWWFAAAALFLLALLAKTSVAPLPFVLLAIALHVRGKLAREDALAAIPFFLVAVVLGVVTMQLQDVDPGHNLTLPDATPVERLGAAGWALGSYLQKAVVPWGLALVYPEWPVGPDSPLFYLPAALLAAAAATLVILYRRGVARPAAVALAFHALLAAPILGFVDIAFFEWAPVSNHLQYLALMGPVALAGFALAKLSARPALARAAAAVLVAVLGAMTFDRARAFADDLTLWRRAVEDSPRSLIAAWEYADQLGEQGRFEEALQEMASSSERARDEALRRRGRAMWLVYSGRFDEAVAEVRAAEALRPSHHFREEIGTILARGGRPEAIDVLGDHLRKAPRDVNARYWLSAALTRAGRVQEAIEILRVSCAIDPEDGRSRDALAGLQRRVRDAQAPGLTGSR